jgi:diacylglycerol diphosphate phosphatase/phosphatidate phosphatase
MGASEVHQDEGEGGAAVRAARPGWEFAPFAANPAQLVLSYLADWLGLAALGAGVLCLNTLLPDHERFFTLGEPAFSYPYHPDTVSSSADTAIAVGVPLAACAVSNMILACSRARARWSVVLDVHHTLLGLITSLALATAVTEFLKHFVGRIRPSGFARLALNDSKWNQSYCSGHTSTAFSGLVFAAFYMAGKAGVFSREGLTFRRGAGDPFCGAGVLALLLIGVPVGIAVLIAATRLTDYAHDFADVNAGAMVGTAAAWWGYNAYFAGLTEPSAYLARPLARLRDRNPSDFDVVST